MNTQDTRDNNRIAQLEERVQRAQDALAAQETFLSNMSHDIRTPMNAIVGMTALAKKHIDEKARVMDALNKIEVASTHLLSLINEVLDISRINSGRLSIGEELFSLGDMLHDILIIIRPQMEGKGHHFTFSVGEVFAEDLHGDPLRLRQIFVNIINNAVKYTPDGGEISVRVSVEPPEEEAGKRAFLLFTCRDNGIGMSEEFLKKLFVPFERDASVAASGIEGTGLGMGIVKSLVEAMSGTIQVESRLGEGTGVTIRVPLRFEEAGSHTGELWGKRLLILEGSREQQDIYRQYLGEAGIAFETAPSMPEALAMLTDAQLHEKSFDGIILGADTGDANCLEIAAYLHKAYPALPLVLASEADWEKIEYRAGRCGIHTFIPVPFFRKSLLRGLDEALSQKSTAGTFGSAPDFSGRHILLAEDNLINREIACEILGSTNAEIDTAEDGKQALDLYLSKPEGYYDLVLMDVQMPVMDGYEATKAIRESGRSDAMPIRIFAMTANTFAEDIARARAAGMNGHIAKPIDISKLMQMLRQIL